MKYRILGKTGFKVSEISFGAWAIGADWGNVTEKEAINALNTAIDNGVNFIDTADVYGDGRSEKIISKVLKSRKEKVYAATKAGRRLNPHTAEGYTIKNIERFVERSLKNLKTDSLDLLQLHCPPTGVYYKPELFEGMDELVKKGKIQNFGVSVEKVEEALKAIEYPGVSTVQIIFNIFRQRPAEKFFQEAKRNNVGIITRVPLASGLLTGKYSKLSKFPKNDHRNYNRKGAAFDVGETFAGVPFETGLKAVDELRKLIPNDMTMAQFALKWILSFKEVSCVIPGAKNSSQAIDNATTSNLQRIDKQTLLKVDNIYSKLIKPHVHQRW